MVDVSFNEIEYLRNGLSANEMQEYLKNDVSFNQMKIYLENQVDDEIKPIEDFVSTFSYANGDKKLIVQYLAIDQLLSNENVKSYLKYEIKQSQGASFCLELNKINNDYKQHLIKQKVLNDYSYLNFRKKFPLN